LRRRLHAWLARHGVSSGEAGSVVLAVSEACNNAIEHAYRDNGAGPIRVSVSGAEPGTLRVVVEDEGAWRDPVPSNERGRGIVLMERLMHSADVQTGLHGTRVALERRVQVANEDAAPEYASTGPGQPVSVDYSTLVQSGPPNPAVSEAPFELRSSRTGDVVVVTVSGEIDLATAPEVARALESGDDASRVVVDLSEVTFLDSSALNALVHGQRELARQNVAFRVVSPADRAVRNVFDITHLTQPLSVVDSLDEALRS